MLDIDFDKGRDGVTDELPSQDQVEALILQIKELASQVKKLQRDHEAQWKEFASYKKETLLQHLQVSAIGNFPCAPWSWWSTGLNRTLAEKLIVDPDLYSRQFIGNMARQKKVHCLKGIISVCTCSQALKFTDTYSQWPTTLKSLKLQLSCCRWKPVQQELS